MLMLMLIPMLAMLALTLMLLFDASHVVTYADVNDANTDANMLNVARHLVGAYFVLPLPPLLPMLMLLRQLLRAYACEDMMLKCVCICVRLRLSATIRECV